jgi:hypothetical protein
VRSLTAFQALTSLSFDETALEWLNALAGRPDARVRWFGGADTAAFTGLETVELPPISVSARPAPVSVQTPAAQPESPNEDDTDLLELSDDIRLSKDSISVSSEPDLQPVVQPVIQPIAEPAVQPVVEVAAAPVASVPTPVIPVPHVIEQPLEVTWPMVTAAWSELLAFSERRTDAARGSETFDRTWREGCIALAERYPELDPFFADVKYAAGTLSVRVQTPSTIEALVAAYQRSLARLGIPLEALEPLVQPIRARHQNAWAAAGLEALWRR